MSAVSSLARSSLFGLTSSASMLGRDVQRKDDLQALPLYGRNPAAPLRARQGEQD